MCLWFSTYIFCDFCFWTSVRGDWRNNNCFGVFLGVMNLGKLGGYILGLNMTSLYTYFFFLRTGRDRNYTTDLNTTSSYMYFCFLRTGRDRNYTTDLNTTSLYTYFKPKQNSKTQKYTKKFKHNKPLHVFPQNIQKDPLQQQFT